MNMEPTEIGKFMDSIPESVYEQSSSTLNSTFRDLVSPLTETTSGLGRYIKQKFDNMVDVEKALANFAIEKALKKANEKADRIIPPQNIKSFVKSIEEVSKEPDSYMHSMWTNLIYAQITGKSINPFFHHVLSIVGPEEAKLLNTLLLQDNLGGVISSVIIWKNEIQKWRYSLMDIDRKEWGSSCMILCELGLANYIVPADHEKKRKEVLLYKTRLGKEFMFLVS